VVDKDGNVITEEGVNGELHIHCPHPMKGYLNNEAATREAFSEDGWVRTGDVGYVRDGRWYVIDRTKDLIKVRGWQVSPAEIEAMLVEHPDITDAAVIGIAAPDGAGEVPLAFVVRNEDTLKEDDVKNFLRSKLARYKGVEEVRFVDSIPRNPTGKVLRRVLRDARGAPPLVTPPEAASAYSNAIKDLEKYQQEHSSERESEGESEASQSHSRTGSLTDASTIESSSPKTPVAPITDAKSMKSRKRKGEALSPTSVKRRSARIALDRLRE